MTEDDLAFTSASFNATAREHWVIDDIVRRARQMRLDIEPLSLCMDLDACISNGCPLDLAGLAMAENFDFIHDVMGISVHLDRSTGKLANEFTPRFAVDESIREAIA